MRHSINFCKVFDLILWSVFNFFILDDELQTEIVNLALFFWREKASRDIFLKEISPNHFDSSLFYFFLVVIVHRKEVFRIELICREVSSFIYTISVKGLFPELWDFDFHDVSDARLLLSRQVTLRHVGDISDWKDAHLFLEWIVRRNESSHSIVESSLLAFILNYVKRRLLEILFASIFWANKLETSNFDHFFLVALNELIAYISLPEVVLEFEGHDLFHSGEFTLSQRCVRHWIDFNFHQARGKLSNELVNDDLLIGGDSLLEVVKSIDSFFAIDQLTQLKENWSILSRNWHPFKTFGN